MKIGGRQGEEGSWRKVMIDGSDQCIFINVWHFQRTNKVL